MKAVLRVIALVVAAIALGVAIEAGLGGRGPVALGDRGPSRATVTVTQAADGRLVTVHLGQPVRVELRTSGLRWSLVQVVGDQLLRRDGPARREGIWEVTDFRAVRTGRAELRATATPRCTSDRACPQFVLLWQVPIVVLR